MRFNRCHYDFNDRHFEYEKNNIFSSWLIRILHEYILSKYASSRSEYSRKSEEATASSASAQLRPCNTTIKTYKKLQTAYAEGCLSRAQIFRWFKEFSKVRVSIEAAPRSRRPLTPRNYENVKRLRNLITTDRRQTVRLISESLNLNHTTVHQVLNNELRLRQFS